MPLYFKTSGSSRVLIKNIYFKNTGSSRIPIARIWYKNTGSSRQLIYENWQYKEGVLVNMTSNNTPSPYSAYSWQWPTAGVAWNVFDSNVTGSALVCSYDTWSHDWGAELYFGKLIRIVEFYRNYGATNQSNWKGLLQGLTEDDNWIDLHRNDDCKLQVVTLSQVNQQIPVKAIRFITFGRTDLHTWINGVRITKWWDRG